MTLLEIQENIFSTLPNRGPGSQVPVDHYFWKLNLPNPIPLDISAVGAGLETGSPIAFTTDKLVLFVRWLGQIDYPFRWLEFQCSFGWRRKGERTLRRDVVAEGSFEAFMVRRDKEVASGKASSSS